MRQISLIISIILMASISAVAQYNQTIEVATLKEFIQALRNNTHIIITSNSMDVSGNNVHFFRDNPAVSRRYDDYGLLITGLKNVKISGEGLVELFTTDVYERVLELEHCEQFVFENINFLHKPLSNTGCMGEVVYISKSKNIRFNRCHFDGSGTIGLAMEDASNIRINNSNFYNNSQNLIYASNVKDITFNQVAFYENSLSSAAIFVHNAHMEFKQCSFTDNVIATRFFDVMCYDAAAYSELFFEQCTFDNNYLQDYILYDRLVKSTRYVINQRDLIEICENNATEAAVYVDDVATAVADAAHQDYYVTDAYLNEYFRSVAKNRTWVQHNYQQHGILDGVHTAYDKAIDDYISNPNQLKISNNSGGLEKVYFILAVYHYENLKDEIYVQNLESGFNFPLYKYWDHTQFTKQQLVNEYRKSWERLFNSVNLIQSIQQKSENVFDVIVDYYFITKKTKTLQKVTSTIRFQFEKGKIKSIYPIKK